MKTKMLERDALQGSAMLTALVIMGILGLVTTSMLYMAMQQPYSVRKSRDHMRAQALAEAGANAAYVMLCTNFSLKDTPAAFPLTNYRDGSYDVSVASMSVTSAVISCVGKYKTAIATVAMDVINGATNLPSSQPAPVGAYSNLITSGGAISWSGAVTIQGGGRVHANQSASYSGNVTLAGDATSSQQITASGNVKFNNTSTPNYSLSGNVTISGTKRTGAVPVVAIPQLDLVPYYNAALANGQVYSGGVSINHDTAPAGGIMWVNGDISISGNCTLTGCFIATGSISMSGNGSQVQVGNYPAFVSQNSSISISGGKSLHGLLYAKVGSISYSGGGNLNGSIICGGSLSMSGNVGIFTYSNPTPVPPGGSGGSLQNNVSISAWRQ